MDTNQDLSSYMGNSGGEQSSHPVSTYMDQSGQPILSPQGQRRQNWAALQQHVNQIDNHAKALGISTHDFLGKLTHPDYASPQGIDWNKLMSDHEQQYLAGK